MRFFLVLLAAMASHLVSAQEIALTFDDAPLGNGPVFTGEERAKKIIDAMKQHDVPGAAFFVVTSFIDEAGAKRLRRYLDAGHVLANHSHTHGRIDVLGTRGYINDIAIADSILKQQFPSQPWYRYPFLNEGRTREVRDSIRDGLKQLGLMNGYVTIDNYDWHLNGALRRALDSKLTIDYNELKKIYLEHILTSIEFYDKIGKKVLGRSPKHVLLLHENDLAAMFLGDLIAALKKKGWTFITPAEAYKDPIATQLPDVTFNGQGRVGAIAAEKGMKPADLVQESEDEQYLDRLLAQRGAFRKP